MLKYYIIYLNHLDNQNLYKLASRADMYLIKMADKLFDHIDNTAKEIASKNDYNYAEHYEKLLGYNKQPPPIELDIDSLSDYIRTKNEPIGVYSEMHPMIYIERNLETKTWKYVIMDPKNLKSLEDGNLSFEEKTTKIPLNIPINVVANHLHRIYPTAIIDTETYQTLEEIEF